MILFEKKSLEATLWKSPGIIFMILFLYLQMLCLKERTRSQSTYMNNNYTNAIWSIKMILNSKQKKRRKTQKNKKVFFQKKVENTE